MRSSPTSVIQPGTDVSDEQKLAIYRAWKALNAIVVDPADGDTYRFDYLNQPAPNESVGRRTTGTIDAQGTITVERQDPAGQPPCPICLARGTAIATPDGDLAVEDVRVGMRVWSFDATGRRVIGTVIRTGRTPVPDSHEVVRLVLGDGRELLASPGHPLSDGRSLGSIRTGDTVDGAVVVSATLERYDGGSTFDLLTDRRRVATSLPGSHCGRRSPSTSVGPRPPDACLRPLCSIIWFLGTRPQDRSTSWASRSPSSFSPSPSSVSSSGSPGFDGSRAWTTTAAIGGGFGDSPLWCGRGTADW